MLKSLGMFGRPPIGVLGVVGADSCACAFRVNASKASVSNFFIKEASFQEDVGKNIKLTRIYPLPWLNYS